MPNNYRMSYFMPPIAPIKDKQGRLMTPPTLIPFCEVSIEQVFQMITCNENLKTPDRTSTECHRYTSRQSIIASVCDPLRHIHPP